MTRPRVAIAHDYLTQRGGAERVVLSLMRAFPDAQVHTLLYDPDGTYPEFRDADIKVSPLNRVSPLRRDHRLALPVLRPFADRMRIDADLTVVSTSGWAHGFPTTGKKLVYCHSPARWLYLSDEYLGGSALSSPKGLALTALQPSLVRWDQTAARSCEAYLSNSTTVRDRIQRVYGFDAAAVFPPFGVTAGGAEEPIAEAEEWLSDRTGFHLVVSRLLPYKNVDRAAAAFSQLPDERLLVIGRGPERDRLIAQAPDNVRFVEGLSDAQMRWAYAHADALIAASFEDFGLTPLEAAAYGKPTFALHAGGYLDTVVEDLNGLWFEHSDADLIADAVQRGRAVEWDPGRIREHAASYDEARFIQELRGHAEAVLGEPL